MRDFEENKENGKKKKKKNKGLRREGSSFEEEDIRGDLKERKNVAESMREDQKGKEDKNREQSEWNVLERES